MTVMKKNKLEIRTILVIVICLSSIAVIRQNILTQFLVTISALILLIIRHHSLHFLVGVLLRLRKIGFAILTVMIMQIVFRRTGEVYWQYWLIKITEDGLLYGFVVGFRLINLILIAGLLFDVSTSEYLLAFKSWKIPYELSFLITTVIRFIPDYYILFNKYKETFQIRGIYIGKLKFRDKMNALVTILTTALITALNGVKQRAISLDMKGFRLHSNRTYLYSSSLTTVDVLLQISVILLSIAAVIAL